MTWQDELGAGEPSTAPPPRQDRSADGASGRAEQAPQPFARAIEVRINPERALPIMLGMIVLLSCASYSGQLLQHGLHVNFAGLNTWITTFDLQGERNVPAWFRWATLLVDALALWTVADDAKIREDGWSRHWRLLAIAFGVFCLDDLMRIHHQLIVVVQKSLHVSDLFFFAWVLPAIALLAALSVMYGRFLWSLPRRTGFGLIGAAALYLSGAVCLSGLRFTADPDTVLRATETTAGVALHMFGMIAVLATVGRYGSTAWTTPVPRITDVIEVADPPGVAATVLDDVTALRPVPAETDGDPAGAWYVGPVTPRADDVPTAPYPAAPYAPARDPATAPGEESPNRLFERPPQAARRSW
ncbi:MAG TPA: hypothetical protein VHN80_05950 [Kineosporiaceae bacterium]|nr:hypothetical protein [Kineosporiaceae bacterium]